MFLFAFGLKSQSFEILSHSRPLEECASRDASKSASAALKKIQKIKLEHNF